MYALLYVCTSILSLSFLSLSSLSLSSVSLSSLSSLSLSSLSFSPLSLSPSPSFPPPLFLSSSSLDGLCSCCSYSQWQSPATLILSYLPFWCHLCSGNNLSYPVLWLEGAVHHHRESKHFHDGELMVVLVEFCYWKVHNWHCMYMYGWTPSMTKMYSYQIAWNLVVFWDIFFSATRMARTNYCYRHSLKNYSMLNDIIHNQQQCLFFWNFWQYRALYTVIII